MRDKRTPKDVCGEASRELTAAMLKPVVFVVGTRCYGRISRSVNFGGESLWFLPYIVPVFSLDKKLFSPSLSLSTLVVKTVAGDLQLESQLECF